MAKHGPDQAWRQHVIDNVLPRMEANTGPAATSFEPAPLAATVAPTPFSAAFPGPPQFDPIELLPPASAERLRLLRVRRSDAYAVTIPHADVQALNVERIEAETRLQKLQAHPQEFGHGLPASDSRVVAQQRLVTKLNDDVRRLEERRETRAAAFQSASAALTNVEDFLRQGVPANCQIEEVTIEPPQLAKNEDLLSALEKTRRRCRELRADQHRIESAPFPSSHAKRKLREMIEQLAQRGTPDVSMLIEHDGDIVWPTMQVRSTVHNAEPGAIAFHEEIDVVGLFAAFLKPTVISFLDGLVDAEQDDPAALSHEQRQQREAEIQGDLLAVEFQESFFVWQAQSQNLPCEHRSDISPLALLGLKLITVPRADAAETSAGHSWPWSR